MGCGASNHVRGPHVDTPEEAAAKAEFAEIKKAFDKWDVDHNGFISRAEVKEVVSHLASYQGKQKDRKVGTCVIRYVQRR
jgi:Ca2+-binding EF-hand superfamily protein